MAAKIAYSLLLQLVIMVAHSNQCPLPSCEVYPNQVNTVDFLNPDRGWYYHTETHTSSYTPLLLQDMTDVRNEDSLTLVYRNFVLDNFKHQALDTTTLQLISNDFDTIRNAHLKIIVRFSYTIDYQDPPPRGDAPKSTILQHISQLGPILDQHSDVILVLQHGFIGTWGEGYYTDYFGDKGSITSQQWADRQEVYDALVANVPECIMIQVRTWEFKERFTSTSSPVSPGDAYGCGNASNARTGIHNDCFLASSTDYGTWKDSAKDRPLFSEHSTYTIVGGESCNPESDRIACPTALQDLQLFHYTYLNEDYHPGVLQNWTLDGCYDTVHQKLGYRLFLVSTCFPRVAENSKEMFFSLVIRNDGFSAPVKKRSLKLVLEKGNQQVEMEVQGTNIDPRYWLGNSTEHTVDGQVLIPSEIESGTWSVYLVIADGSPQLSGVHEYNTLFVNQPAGSQLTGKNDLQREVYVYIV